MYLKTGLALIAATFAMTSMETSAQAFGKKLFANGGNGGSLNFVVGSGNRVGNGGRGGNILSSGGGGLAGLLGGHRSSASGGNGGGLNVVIGNNNRVGNGGNGGNILDLDD